MNRVQVLDCTLRDGGYCNQWKFGYDNICKITAGLTEANLDIIECGFLTNRVTYDQNVTKFTDLSQIAEVIPQNRDGKMFVAMMNYGEYDLEQLPAYDGTSIDGIRVAFHKKDLVNALKVCEEIREKGYKVFVQAMVSLSYADEEFLDLIRRANALKPYAFYIVDSFGMMKRKDLIRLFYMIEHNLAENIHIGFHSHNNMQLAYSNAQTLVTLQTSRDLIVDSSVYGMGRGAGNLNTELFVEFLNDNNDGAYSLKPLLKIIDEILNDFYQKNYWGYSLPNYLSAVHNAHPNYASYLDDKKTLLVEDMNEIFSMLEPEKRVEFDKAYIEELYLRYMETGKVQDTHRSQLRETLVGKAVLLIAPGKTSEEEKDKILQMASCEDVVTISVNFDYPHLDEDFIFLSNLRRFKDLGDDVKEKCIVTSNIPAEKTYLQVNYRDLINSVEAVKDNAGMMAIKLMKHLGARKIYLAGFDGYSHDHKDNYANDQLAFITRNAVLDAMNVGMMTILEEYSKEIEIDFLTTPRFVSLNK